MKQNPQNSSSYPPAVTPPLSFTPSSAWGFVYLPAKIVGTQFNPGGLVILHSILPHTHTHRQMKSARLIHWNTPNRRKAISSLFVLTFFASVVTVSTSNGLPCPARHNRRAYLDSEDDGTGRKNANVHVVEKKQRRWIQETRPTGHWP